LPVNELHLKGPVCCSKMCVISGHVLSGGMKLSERAAEGPRVRVAAVLVEDGRMMVVRQFVTPTRQWSLPGGKMELGETIGQCLVREVKEETGLEVSENGLIYVTDRFQAGAHIVHMTFLVNRAGQERLPFRWDHLDESVSRASQPLREVRMAPLNELEAYGFSSTFCQLAIAGFPGRGAYKGDFERFYGGL
jgi:ADP-ribose pyrophosphatase YjhB (NUDIX family)